MAGLTAKQQRFVEEYLIDLNATQAAIRAGYSERTAYSQGQRLLKHVEVAALLQAKREEQSKRTEITADRVLQELARIAFFDPRKLFDHNGNIKPVQEWDDDTAAVLAGIEAVEEFAGRGDERELIGYLKKAKVWDKKGALELLGKHLALFTDKVEHSGSIGTPELRVVVKRADKPEPDEA